MKSSSELQIQLANYCRTGENPPPSSKPENMHHYRRLVYNIMRDTLDRAFPIARHLLTKEEWKNLCDAFIEEHPSPYTQVWKLSKAFCEYYENQDHVLFHQHPYLKELFTFEWLEIEVFMMEDIKTSPFYPFKVWDEHTPLIGNPEIRIQVLQYPLFKKHIKKMEAADQGQYLVAIHRTFTSKKVKFNEISIPMMEILVALNEEHLSIAALKQKIAKYYPASTALEKNIKELIHFGITNELILGYQ